MLELFRNNRPTGIFLLLLYTFLVRLPALLGWSDEPVEAEHSGVLGTSSFWIFFQHQTKWSVIVAGLIVFVQSLIINDLDTRFRIANGRTWLPAAAYILLTGLFPQTIFLSPTLISITFLPLALGAIFSCYKQIEANDLIFNAGFWVGVSSLFFPLSILLLIPLFLGLLSLKSMNFRENMVFLSGFIVPSFLCWTVYFLMDEGGVFWERQFGQMLALPRFFEINEIKNWAAIGVATLLCLFVLLLIGSFYAKKLIQVQKFLNVFYWLLLSGVLIFVFSGNFNFRYFLIALVPLAQFLGMFFGFSKQKTLSEGVHLILLMALVYLQVRFL